jgi:MoaA/NifB/PqqE/SkfB family radical SAM enzyme
MKLICVYTPSHKKLKDKWFLPSLRDKFEIEFYEFAKSGDGNYLESDWTEAVLFKCEVIIKSIKDHPGEIIFYSDVDIIFFAKFKERVLQALEGKDIVCQVDDPYGSLCTGFFALRSNRLTLKLWEEVHEAVKTEGRNQPAFNRIIRGMKDIHYEYLPVTFFGAGTFRPVLWKKGDLILLPENPVMFHANWTMGIGNKTFLLRQVKNIIRFGRIAILVNNRLCRLRYRGKNAPKAVAGLLSRIKKKNPPFRQSYNRSRKVSLEASSVCQLKCPTCPTARGATRHNVGSGVLSPHDFKKFIDQNPYITEIELSNWGEVFLNPGLNEIFRLAYENQVVLTINNGANLNNASGDALEALVKYRVRSISCSIDGASQEVYSQYRVNGNFDKVIEHIRKINQFKSQYNSQFPYLSWQFVAFGHNEHEIEKARQLAESLNMKFKLKLSWDDFYFEKFSPVMDKEKIRSLTEAGVADRDEYEEKYGVNYLYPTCFQMWHSPRINYDGKLLGCSVNYWDHYGNVYEKGLEECLQSEKMTAARRLLMGEKVDRTDIPCFKCKVYKSMVQSGKFVTEEELGR